MTTDVDTRWYAPPGRKTRRRQRQLNKRSRQCPYHFPFSTAPSTRLGGLSSSARSSPTPSLPRIGVRLREPLLLSSLMTDRSDGPIGRLPEHLLVEIFVHLPVCQWVQVACVNKQWASIFQGDCLWQTAIARNWPSAGLRKRWPGPIPRGSARRRFQALYVCENLVPSGGEIDELVGHTYLYLKEQLERPAMPPSSILHGTIIDQFIACGKTGEKAHDLASKIWLAVIDGLEENEQTFLLLKHLAREGEFFLPFPYSRSYKVLWRVFDKLFTDFRDCFSGADYHDALSTAKSRFQPVPSTWLGH